MFIRGDYSRGRGNIFPGLFFYVFLGLTFPDQTRKMTGKVCKLTPADIQDIIALRKNGGKFNGGLPNHEDNCERTEQLSGKNG